MPTTPQILANGQLPSSKGTLFTATASTIVRLMTAVHVSGATQTIVFYVKKAAGVSRVVSRAEIAANEFAVDDEIYTLETGDQIEGQSTNATSVDYVLTGVVIT